MSIHQIDLRGPWEVTGPSESVPMRRTLPAAWREFSAEKRGRMILERRFHAPTNLTPDERVYLRIDRLRSGGVVRLNDLPLAAMDQGASTRLDITAQLRPSNRLRIELEMDGDAATDSALIFEAVALEIESSPAAN